MITLDAVDGDGHQLCILVDGDGDLGLRGAGGEQHQAGESNEEGTHFTLGLLAILAAAPFLTVPEPNMHEVRLRFQWPVSASLM